MVVPQIGCMLILFYKFLFNLPLVWGKKERASVTPPLMFHNNGIILVVNYFRFVLQIKTEKVFNLLIPTPVEPVDEGNHFQYKTMFV